MITLSSAISTIQSPVFGVRQGIYVTTKSLHVSNAGVDGTFTVYVKPPNSPAVAITPIDQAIAANAVAVCTDAVILQTGTALEVVASHANMSLLFTGLETTS